jgi:hypothetical protein
MSFIRAAEFAHAMGRIDTPMGETLSVGALPIARRRTRSQRNLEATCYRKNLVYNNAYPHAPLSRGHAFICRQQGHIEAEIVANHNLGGREQRIVQPPELFRPQVGHPIGHNRSDVIAYRKEGGNE